MTSQFDEAAAIRGRWAGETLCLKKKAKPGDKTGFMGYAAFGVIVNKQEPVTVYLRGDNPRDDFKTSAEYNTIDAMLADGWVVD